MSNKEGRIEVIFRPFGFVLIISLNLNKTLNTGIIPTVFIRLVDKDNNPVIKVIIGTDCNPKNLNALVKKNLAINDKGLKGMLK